MLLGEYPQQKSVDQVSVPKSALRRLVGLRRLEGIVRTKLIGSWLYLIDGHVCLGHVRNLVSATFDVKCAGLYQLF